MAREKEFLGNYSRFSPKAKPADFLSGDANKRDVEITFVGKREDDLSGSVKRRFLSDLNRFFWEHPKDVDDTRLVFEAVEEKADYSEDGRGGAKMSLKIRIELSTRAPDTCGCC